MLIKLVSPLNNKCIFTKKNEVQFSGNRKKCKSFGVITKYIKLKALALSQNSMF